MSIEVGIIGEGEWHRYDRRRFTVEIEGPEVNLETTNLRFVIRTRPGGPVVLEKLSGSGITVAQNTQNEWRIVHIDVGIDQDDYENLYSSVYRLELYDTDAVLKIGEWSATLGEGLPSD